MADLVQTAANVAPGTVANGAAFSKGLAGAALDAGSVVYQDTADSKYKAADASAAATAIVAGILVCTSEADGQMVNLQTQGPINVGATLTTGETYALSDTEGKIMPVADLSTGEYVTILGVATSTSILELDIQVSGTARAELKACAMTLRVSQTVAPTFQVVDIERMRDYLRILDGRHDRQINDAVAAATRYVERRTKRQLATATLRLDLEDFPGGVWFQVPRPPLVSVTTLKYVDAAGDVQTWDAANYQVDTYQEPGRIYLAPSVTWPETLADRIDAVQLTYVAGSAAEAIDADLVRAVQLMAGHFFANREATISGIQNTEVQLAVDALIDASAIRVL